MFFLITRAVQQVSGLIFQPMNYLILKLLDTGRQSGITDGIGKISILGEDKSMKAFLSDQCKEIEETTEWERLQSSSRKLEISREHFMQIWAR